MAKSFADIEQDLRFQLDLVRLAEALRSPVESRSDATEKHAGMMEELVRVQRRKRPGSRFNG
ncbi:MAG: hypothetical protein NTY38_01435 [Acidobacteria bacterium]|nr:hypothetical protein [Acidobacteriota bacterium]